MKIALFSEDLRECLNAAGFSDCGENDAWNYWYQRLMKSHNECADRGILTEQAENAKLRELVADALLSTKDYAEKYGGPSNAFDASDWRIVHLRSRGRELGVEVES